MKKSEFEKPGVTADIVIFTVDANELKVLLVSRGIEPFLGSWSIPGGYVPIDESIEDAAKRKLEEKTGVKNVYLEQLYTFGDLGRDPRGRVITVTYYALVNSNDVKLINGKNTNEAKWFNVKNLPSLGFDHGKILDYAIKRLRWKFEYTPAAFSLLSKKFKLSELMALYEIVFDKKFDKRNFNKKIHSLGILKEVGREEGVSYRPATLYSLKSRVPEILGII